MNQEQIRQKVAKQYKDKINQLKSEKDNLILQNVELKDENSALKEKIRQQEEWIERLLEYCDMSPEEFEKLKENMQKNADLKELMEQAICAASPFLKYL